MAPRLKVFVTSDGLTDFVVATTSKTKALAAWGTSQDLFKAGRAHETDDASLVKAATAQPDQVLRRPAGTRVELAKLKAAKTALKAAPAGPSAAQRKKVAALEKKLAAAEAAFDRAARTLQGKRAKLDAEIADLERRRTSDLARLREELSAAKRAPG